MAANGNLLRRPPGVNWLADRPGNVTVASPTQNRLTAWLRGAQSLMPPHGAHPRNESIYSRPCLVALEKNFMKTF